MLKGAELGNQAAPKLNTLKEQVQKKAHLRFVFIILSGYIFFNK
jgi:hypothetical protein